MQNGNFDGPVEYRRDPKTAKQVMRELADRALGSNPKLWGITSTSPEAMKPGYFYEYMVSDADKRLLKELKSEDIKNETLILLPYLRS